MPLIDHPTGNYRFLSGIAPYSCGVVSLPGYEIVHVTFRRPLPYRQGLERAAEFLASEQRPQAALCGVELRSPKPFTFAGFDEFNAGYVTVLETWRVFVDGLNPVARTNVAPEVTPPAEPELYGFSYTKPAAGDVPLTFVVAGGGELPEGALSQEQIIAPGLVSPATLETKARFVVDLMENRMVGLGVGWQMATAVNVYTIYPIDLLMPEILLRHMRPADAHGIRWSYSRPPITEIEFEMDLRGVQTELWL